MILNEKTTTITNDIHKTWSFSGSEQQKRVLGKLWDDWGWVRVEREMDNLEKNNCCVKCLLLLGWIALFLNFAYSKIF